MDKVKEAQDRDLHIDQLSKLLSVMQDMARKLADESHGRAYDKARELTEILHLAREQIGSIQADNGNGAAFAEERRKLARSRFGDLA